MQGRFQPCNFLFADDVTSDYGYVQLKDLRIWNEARSLNQLKHFKFTDVPMNAFPLAYRMTFEDPAMMEQVRQTASYSPIDTSINSHMTFESLTQRLDCGDGNYATSQTACQVSYGNTLNILASAELRRTVTTDFTKYTNDDEYSFSVVFAFQQTASAGTHTGNLFQITNLLTATSTDLNTVSITVTPDATPFSLTHSRARKILVFNFNMPDGKVYLYVDGTLSHTFTALQSGFTTAPTDMVIGDSGGASQNLYVWQVQLAYPQFNAAMIATLSSGHYY